VPGVDCRLIDPAGHDVPFDGVSQGEVLLRGPWIIESYHKLEEDTSRFLGGYWRSGDLGTIDPDGYLKLTDRLKDVIKSGGEWISSIDMENAITAHPRITEAAVIGAWHPNWQVVVDRVGVRGRHPVREAREYHQASLAADDAALVMQILSTAYLQVTRQWGDVIRVVIDVAPHDDESGAVLATAQRRHDRSLAEICRHLEDIGASRDDVDARLARRIITYYYGIDGLLRTRDVFGWSLERTTGCWLMPPPRSCGHPVTRRVRERSGVATWPRSRRRQ